MNLKDAATLGPLVLAAAFLGALEYAAGYFRYIDREWLTYLTTTDLFALTWIILPTVVMAFLVGATLGTMGFGTAASQHPADRWRQAKGVKKVYLTIYILGVRLFPLVGANFPLVFSQLPPELFFLPLVFTTIWFACMLQQLEYYVPAQRKARFFVFALAGSSAMFAYSMGMVKSAEFVNINLWMSWF